MFIYVFTKGKHNKNDLGRRQKAEGRRQEAGGKKRVRKKQQQSVRRYAQVYSYCMRVCLQPSVISGLCSGFSKDLVHLTSTFSIYNRRAGRCGAVKGIEVKTRVK